MADPIFPAISSFEFLANRPSELKMDPYSHGVSGVDDNIQVRVAPSGISARGRYWREGRYLKAVVHVQAAGVSPKTISAEVDLRPIALALKQRSERLEREGVHVGGWPGSFIKAVAKVGKSKLIKDVSNAVKSVAQSKLTGAAVGAAAVVFPPVGVPAAAAYATANAAISTLERANEVKNVARNVLANGTAAQKAALSSRSAEIQEALSRAATVKDKLREIAKRAQQGDVGARKTARIFSHVMAHRQRVQSHDAKLQGSQMMPGLLVTELGKIIPGRWLFAAASEQANAQALTGTAQRIITAAPPGSAPLLLGPPRLRPPGKTGAARVPPHVVRRRLR